MVLLEHVEAANRVTIRRLRRQRGIAFNRGHVDAGLALNRGLAAMGSENELQQAVAEALRKSATVNEQSHSV